jgi:trimethylamine--corrinoid protein Co-methyltransferase
MTRVPVLIVGAGMITQEVVFPTVWQEQRRGRVGEIRVASRRAASLKKLANLYPSASFISYPDMDATDPEESHPDAYRQAISDLEEGGVVIVATPDDFHTPVILDAIRAVPPGGHHLGTEHTMRHFESAFYRAKLFDYNSAEQWQAEGSRDAYVRASAQVKQLLQDYQPPALDPAAAEALLAFIARRKAELTD